MKFTLHKSYNLKWDPADYACFRDKQVVVILMWLGVVERYYP